MSLSAKCPLIQNHSNASGSAHDVNGNIEDRLWPFFGASNDTYHDRSTFWGDDIISKLFENIFKAISSIIGPVVKENLVPLWNRTMNGSLARVTLFSVIVWILGIIGNEAIKDIYKQLKRRSI